MEKYVKIILQASLDAGKVIMEVYNSESLGIELKADDSPVTKADLAANDVIVAYLETTGIPVLSEEGRSIPYNERKNWEQLWIVDPLDGTKEFIKKNGEFTVNIALIEKGIPVLGVIYAPALNEIYYGSPETGSFKALTAANSTVEEILDAAQQLPLPKEHSTYRIAASRSHLSKETEDFIEQEKKIQEEIELISRGSSLKFCMLAEGRIDCYPRFAPTMEWDTAAGQAICNAAGAKLIDWTTKAAMVYNRENLLNGSFVVRRHNSPPK